VRLEPGIAGALRRLDAGGLVAFPTETVWGIAGIAASERAVTRLARWKGRAETQPIAVLVPDLAALEALGAELPLAARRLAAAYWPGPLTLVVRCPAAFAPGIANAAGGVGFRCSPHPAARALVAASFAAGLGALTATSLNRSGAAPARTRAEATRLCGERAGEPALLAGTWKDAGGGAPSTVIDLCSGPPRVVRSGALEARAVLDCAEGAA